jgi:C-terminal processing protease CtpA/Prc
VYRSERVAVSGAASPGDARSRWVADLGGGVSCVVPLALYADARGTLPHPARRGPAAHVREPLSAKDRATRLAAVALAWNVFQHFYPYFDVVGTDWPRALDEALRTAAVDPDETAFLGTLRRLVAGLHDGHGNVFHPRIPEPQYLPPIRLAFAEGRLAVESVEPDAAGDLKPGDVVVALDGRPAAEALARTEALISGATVGWKRWRALGEGALLRGPRDSPLTLTVRRPGENGPPRTITLRRTLLRADPGAGLARPAQIDEVKPGIFYVDLDRITDQDFESALPRLAKAEGIVFDLRGYPRRVSPDLLGHLTDRPVTSARWNIPIITRPDRRGMTFAFSNWTVAPRTPRLRAKIAFVTDGRAISYAETYLGIIEHYKLAEIAGEPTAGTNGNINFLTLPGGYRVVWTGMKVLKHDGSRHHGVGIRPTVPVSRTLRGIAEGRDELLERAIEVVRISPARAGQTRTRPPLSRRASRR